MSSAAGVQGPWALIVSRKALAERHAPRQSAPWSTPAFSRDFSLCTRLRSRDFRLAPAVRARRHCLNRTCSSSADEKHGVERTISNEAEGPEPGGAVLARRASIGTFARGGTRSWSAQTRRLGGTRVSVSHAVLYGLVLSGFSARSAVRPRPLTLWTGERRVVARHARGNRARAAGTHTLAVLNARRPPSSRRDVPDVHGSSRIECNFLFSESGEGVERTELLSAKKLAHPEGNLHSARARRSSQRE